MPPTAPSARPPSPARRPTTSASPHPAPRLRRAGGQTADAETGYYDNWHRTYDPSLGRYLQSDPIGLAGGWNRYAYAGGNPVMYADPMGLKYGGAILIGAVSGVLAGVIVEMGMQYYQNGCISDWGAVAWSGVQGALMGAFAAATWGMAPVGYVAANGLAGAGFGAAVAEAQGNNPWVGAGSGLAGGVVGAGLAKGIAAVAGKVFGSAADDAANSMYHYTSDAGLEGILSSKKLNPSLKANNPKDARYGDGQYVTDILPGTKSNGQLSNALAGIPWLGKKFKNYVEIDVSGLNVVKGREGVSVIPNDKPLDLTGRIISHGSN